MSTGKGKILLVDDKTDLISCFYWFQNGSGFTIEQVQSPLAACQRLESHRYDFIVSNDLSPDGERLDSLAKTLGIPVLRLITLKGLSKEPHLKLDYSDIIVLEDAFQRIEFPLVSCVSLELALKDIDYILNQMLKMNRESAQFSNKHGDPFRILCSAPVPIIINTDGIIDWANEKMAHFLGYCPGSLQGVPLQEIFSNQKEYDGFCSSMQAKINDSGWCLTKADLLKKNGEPVSSRIKVQKMQDGSDIIICEDMSGQDALQEVIDAYEGKIRGMEFQYMKIFRNMDVIVVRTNAEGEIVFLNETGERLFGYTAEDIIGKNITDTLVSPGSPAARDLHDHIADCSNTGDDYSVFAIYHPTGYGTDLCIAWRMVTLRDGDRVGDMVFIGENLSENAESGTANKSWKPGLLEGTDVREEVFDSVLHICIELSRKGTQGQKAKTPSLLWSPVLTLSQKGKEGQKAGTSFIIGDSNEVMARSRQVALNHFEGQEKENRMVTNPRNKEYITWCAQLDGGFVISGDGLVEASGRRFLTDDVSVSLSPGFGKQYAPVAGITALTRSIGIVVSEGAGKLTVFKGGKIVRSLAF